MKKYLFDFDGTLVDSMPTYCSVMLRILDECNVKYSSDIMKIITPLGYRDTAKYFIEKLGVPLSFEEIVARMGEYAIYEYEHNVLAKDGVEETLRELKRRGASLNILTASPHETLDPCLKRLGLFDIFDNVWSCNDFNTNKADVNIYKMAAKALGTSVDNVIFLDDNLNADITAKAAGMTVIGVYDKSSEEYQEQIKEVCDGYIFNMKELMGMINL